MKLQKVGFSLAVTCNLPNYNSVRLQADCEYELETGTKEEVMQTIQQARRVLFIQLEGLKTESYVASLKGLNQEVGRVWKETTEKAAAEKYAQAPRG